MASHRGFVEVKLRAFCGLAQIDTKSGTNTEEADRAKLEKNLKLIEEYQTLLYANRRNAMLIIFQGMDAAGKDGAIKHVLSGINPQGCSVISFKTPSSIDLSHDYLWQSNQALPERGQIGIFNRSYYEEVLITRVHPELLQREMLPNEPKVDENFWKHRYGDIVNYESYLNRQGYDIVKIFIHISKSEQKRRLLDRIQDPKKHWKFSEADVAERKYWNKYQSVHDECIRETATRLCPWYIVAGDNKVSARLAISEILVSRFKSFRLRYPELSRVEKIRLNKLKHLLESE